jgi:hypothetical protein
LSFTNVSVDAQQPATKSLLSLHSLRISVSTAFLLSFVQSPTKNRRPARVWTAARSHRSWRSAAIQTLGWASYPASSACSRTFSFSLLCTFLALSASWRFAFTTKNPPVRAGSFALLMLSKPKIPDLDRAALLGFLGERNIRHDSSFENNTDEFNAQAFTFQCASCLNFMGKAHRSE